MSPPVFSHLMSSPNQRTLTNPCHRCNLPVCLPLFQKGKRKLNLLRGEFLRSAVFEVGILSCGGLAGLGALYDHTPFVFGKGQHHGQNQVAGQGVLDQCVRRFTKSSRPAKLSSDSAQIEQWDRPD